MDKDIQFALVVLKEGYKTRRETLINGDLEPRVAVDVLFGLETISAAIIKIEHRFEEVQK